MIQTIERRSIQKGSVYRMEIMRVEGRVLGLRKETYESGAEDYFLTYAEKGFVSQGLVIALEGKVLRFSHTGRVLHATDGSNGTVGQLINSNEEVKGLGISTLSTVGLSGDQMKDFLKSDKVVVQVTDNHDIGSVTLMTNDAWAQCQRHVRAFMSVKPL